MPELPDVELFRQYLESTALNRRIGRVRVLAPEMLDGASTRTLRSRLERQRFVRTHRHGKLLFAGLAENGWLVLHFGMTGFLEHYERPDEAPRHVRLRIDFADGWHLAYDDQRKFGRILMTDDLEGFLRERRLGPDPLEAGFDVETFHALLSRRRGGVKAALMNQRVLAGIGNIYADEILFQARLHPETRLDRLDASRLRDLYRAITRVLTKAIDTQANPDRLPRSYLLRQRRGGHCPRYGRALAQLKVGMRTSYYCPRDQPRRV